MGIVQHVKDDGDINGALLWSIRGLEMVPGSNRKLERVLQTSRNAHAQTIWPTLVWVASGSSERATSKARARSVRRKAP